MLSSINGEEELVKFAKDLADRFGPIPKQVNDLMDLILLREFSSNQMEMICVS